MPSENNKRIARNTLMLYIRMLLMMVITLYTSRVVIDKLGVSDFGIYSVVGGIVATLGFLNGAMANTVQRFLSFELGRKNNEGVHRVFCVSLTVHAAIALIVALIMEIFGVWYVDNYLNIPPDRLSAAQWVLQCTIFTTMFTIMQVPYNAVIISQERMGVYAYISVLEAVLKLAIVYLLGIIAFDKLKLYSVLVMVVTIGILMTYRIYCVRRYKETHFEIIKDKKLLKQITSFAGWNVTSELAWSLTGPGVNIILNWFFGPIVNAAMGVAHQVNTAVNRFVQSFQTAVNPQIVKMYSAGDIRGMNALVYRSTRFSFYLLLVLSLPLILQMDYVMGLWLVKIPDNASLYCQLILVCSLVSVLSTTLPKVAWATGNIRNYQLIVSAILVLNFPLSYIVLRLGAPALSVILVNIGIQTTLIFVRLYLTSHMTGSPMAPYIRQVIIRCLAVAAAAAVIPIFLVLINPTTDIIAFVLTTAICLVSSCLSCLFVGMDGNERLAVKSMWQNKVRRIGGQ